MPWWKKTLYLLSFVLLIEGLEKLIDLIIGDGDGKIERYHFSYYISFFQFLVMLFLVNWIFYFKKTRFHDLIKNTILTISYLLPVFIFEIVFYGVLHDWIRIQSLDAVTKKYYQNNRKLIQFDESCSVYDPELFYTLSPGECSFSSIEFQNSFHINSMGLRDDENSLIAPDVISLGDSFAMGWGVNQDSTYAQIFEHKSGLKVLNAGISSYGTARELLLLKRLDLSNLKFVILQYCFNDFEENKTFLENNYTLPISNQSFYHDKRLFETHRKGYFFGKYTSFFLSNQVRSDQSEIIKNDKKEEANVFLAILKHIYTTINGKRIIIIDTCTHLSGNKFNNYLNKEIINNQYRNTRLIDISKELDQSCYFRLDEHLNEKGHLLIAQKLMELSQ